jgi:hypothetical protein
MVGATIQEKAVRGDMATAVAEFNETRIGVTLVERNLLDWPNRRPYLVSSTSHLFLFYLAMYLLIVIN